MRTPLIAVLGGLLLVTATKAQSPPENTVPCVEGQTAQLAYGDHTSGCEIDFDLDIDFFTFEGATNDQIRIRLWAPEFNEFVEFRDPTNNPLAGCVSLGNAEPFHQVCVLPVSGIYTIRVSDIGFNAVLVSYLIQLDKMLPVPAWATGLPYDSPRIETIDPLIDMDDFQFKGRASTEVRIVVFNKSLDLQPRLWTIWFPSGGGQGTMGPWSCLGNGCFFVVDYTLPESGTFFLTFGDNDWMRTGDYQVSIQCLFGLCPTGYYIDSLVFTAPDTLEWDPTSDPTATYDVVRGDLTLLHSSIANFATSVTHCVSTGSPLPFASDLDPLDPGAGFFYLLRAVEAEIGVGSYDSASPSQLSTDKPRAPGPGDCQ